MKTQNKLLIADCALFLAFSLGFFQVLAAMVIHHFAGKSCSLVYLFEGGLCIMLVSIFCWQIYYAYSLWRWKI